MTELPKVEKLFASDLVCVNIGPVRMGEAMARQGVKTIQVDWKPIAGGDKELRALLERLGY